MDKDTSHLTVIHQRLCRDRELLATARTEKERALRVVWLAQTEKELADELAFLGMDAMPLPDMSDDELARQLSE